MIPHPDTGTRAVLTREQSAHLAAARARSDLTEWERNFLREVERRGCPLSEKQATALAGCALPRLDFAAINRAAMARLPDLLTRWLPGGRVILHEWTCASLCGGEGTSCRVNLRTGRWADFATDQKGGDPLSLAAAVAGLPTTEAARGLAAMLGMGGARHD